MLFIELNKKIQDRFLEMQQYKLFRSTMTGQEVWDTYINGFLPEENPVFRDPNSSTQNCNNDKNFLRRYGNIVAITPAGELLTMFDIAVEGEFKTTIPNLAKILRAAGVSEVFVETFDELNSLPYERTNKQQTRFQLGHEKTLKKYTQEECDKFGVVNPDNIYTFNHFHVFLDKRFVDFSGKSAEAIMGLARDAKNVFQRALVEIPLDTLELVRDLIVQGSLLNGNTYLDKVNAFIQLKKEYDEFTGNKDLWCWYKSLGLGIAKFRNEVIGTLCQDLAEGMEINAACQAWNKKVDPTNFMKATAPVTKKQIQDAERTIENLGYLESITSRRFAELFDIDASEIRFKDVDGKQVVAGGLFDKMKVASTRHRKAEFDGVETVNIERFMKEILPSCTAVSLYLENQHQSNLVALFTGQGKNMFKWNNQFSWTYANNLTGVSSLTQMVAAKGGRVDGVFRFTHSWNRLAPNQSLMDLHVFMPDCPLPKQNTGGPNIKGRRVGWNNREDFQSGGVQDVDYVNQAPPGYIPVENITFPDITKMPNGKYECYIHNWNFRGTAGEGEAEIAINGDLYQYVYPKTKNHQWVHVATVTLANNRFSIEHHLPETNVNKTIWNLQTGEFHRCNLICHSPNFWGDNNQGNLHYFFMLDGCKSDIALRSFHAEYLNSELYGHRKVLDYLANTIMIEPADKQLAGVGFNSTIENEVILKLEGSHKRIIKVKIK